MPLAHRWYIVRQMRTAWWCVWLGAVGGIPPGRISPSSAWRESLLLVTEAAAGHERQRSPESLAELICPFDEQMSGYYVIDSSMATFAMARGALQRLRMHFTGWRSFAVDRRHRSCGLGMSHRGIAGISDEHVAALPPAPRGARPARIVAKRQAIMAAGRRIAGASRNRAITVRQLMTETVLVAPPSTSVHTLINLLASSPLRHILICEHGGRLLGIVTDRDLRHRRGKRAADLMTRGPVCVPSGALLGPATALMVDHQISCLPVIDEGRVRGVLTSDDIALALECAIQAQEAPARQPAAADETVVLSDLQGLCETVRSGNQSDVWPRHHR